MKELYRTIRMAKKKVRQMTKRSREMIRHPNDCNRLETDACDDMEADFGDTGD
jgi:hypothetical protein